MEKNGKKNNFFTTLTPEQMELKKGFIRNYANKINNAIFKLLVAFNKSIKKELS